MRLKCDRNSISSLSEKCRAIYRTGAQTAPITENVSYQAYSMGLWGAVLFMLVFDDNRLPNWYPAEFFSIEDSQLPLDWFFSKNDVSTVVGFSGPPDAIWGYERIVREESHYTGILEREEEHLRYFLRKVMEQERLREDI